MSGGWMTVSSRRCWRRIVSCARSYGTWLRCLGCQNVMMWFFVTTDEHQIIDGGFLMFFDGSPNLIQFLKWLGFVFRFGKNYTLPSPKWSPSIIRAPYFAMTFSYWFQLGLCFWSSFPSRTGYLKSGGFEAPELEIGKPSDLWGFLKVPLTNPQKINGGPPKIKHSKIKQGLFVRDG